MRHKVRGRLLPPRYVKTGVDMGRAFSVFLFCIGMGPVLTLLNRIPGVISVQGYIDDTTLAGRGRLCQLDKPVLELAYETQNGRETG